MPRLARWALLLVTSALFIAALEAIRTPAAFLLGPMAAGVLLAVGPGPVGIARAPFDWAQATVGCLIAQSITPALLVEIGREWPIFAVGVLAVVLVGLLSGWLLTRLQSLPGPTAIWGALPGAATPLVLMAGDYGADTALVAVMQYIRVVSVSVLAAAVAALALPSAPGPSSSAVGIASWDWIGLAETALVIVAVSDLARRLRVPAGPLLAAMVVGAVLQDTHLLTIVLPRPVLAIGYAVVGWGIGLRFTRQTLREAAHALPAVVASTLAVVAACAGLAGLLVYVADIGPMTAYLATSPGGASSVAIIASDSRVDVAYVMAMQIVRALFLMLAGPFLARWISRGAGFEDGRAG